MECTEHSCAFENALWGRSLAGVLWRLGCRQGVVSPGARSAPLALAIGYSQGYVAQGTGIELIPALDERSAAFFALGLAKKSHRPVVLLCTSGSAAANFLPAIVEAKHSRVPLLVLTADRPPELQQCGARQTLEQAGMYGSFVARSQTLPLPECVSLPALRTTLVASWTLASEESLPVHLNIPMREPLFSPEGWQRALAYDLEPYWSAVTPPLRTQIRLTQQDAQALKESWKTFEKGLIVVGPHCPEDPELFCAQVDALSKNLGWPVLVDALGPLRFRAPQWGVSSADTFLKNEPHWPALRPDAVLALGPPPVARSIRSFLEKAPAARTWVWSRYLTLEDPLHRGAVFLKTELEALMPAENSKEGPRTSAFLKSWMTLESETRNALNAQLEGTQRLCGEKLPYMLQTLLPEGTPLFIANSLSVRHFSTYTRPCQARWLPYCSRGVDGIDGTLSTALGIAHRNRPTVLICGDLAFLHDMGGLLLSKELEGSLSVIVVNNHGGQIFKSLALAQAPKALFERTLLTPQRVELPPLLQAHHAAYHRIETWQHLGALLASTLASKGLHVLELREDEE